MVLKYRFGIWRGVDMPHGQVGSLALVDNLTRDDVLIKILVVVQP